MKTSLCQGEAGVRTEEARWITDTGSGMDTFSRTAWVLPPRSRAAGVLGANAREPAASRCPPAEVEGA
ncbi:hypothetical protein GCM10009763_23340 [Dermacoccus profundi]|uniref:Uncharacterized protein n=2 Tax=Dermacoccus TaxID=57495 RepID=A0ABN2B0N3_9MICO